MFCAYFFQLFIQVVKALADDLGISADTHKACIALPPRHYMDMQMLRHTCAGTAADISADIKPVRVDRQPQRFLHIAHKGNQLDHFFAGGMLKIPHMPEGADEHVPVVVGVTVEHYRAVRCAPQEQIFFVVFGMLDIVAEKTFMLLDDAANIVHSPRGPYILVLQRKTPLANLNYLVSSSADNFCRTTILGLGAVSELEPNPNGISAATFVWYC